MASRPWRIRLEELWRFYKIGAINTLVGYGLYALALFVGFNLFAAQIGAHLAGMTFNYFMFRRHVFRQSDHPVFRYLASYGVNYGVALAFLWAAHRLIASPYIDGLVALVCASAVNYVSLKYFVFTGRRAAP